MPRVVYLPEGVYTETGARLVLVGSSIFKETSGTGAGDTGNTSRVDNVSTIFTANMVLKPAAARFDNSSTIYTATTQFQIDTARVDNQSVFYTAVATVADTVQPSRVDNSSVFYSASEVSIVYPSRVDNSSTIFTASSDAGVVVTVGRVDNTTVFYSAFSVQQPQALLFENDSVFYTSLEQAIVTPAYLDTSTEFFRANTGAGGETIVLSNAVVIDPLTTDVSVTLQVETDTPRAGLLYCYVSLSPTPPSIVNLKDGTGAVFHAIDYQVTTFNSFVVTGLSPGTVYYGHFYQEDGIDYSNVITTAGVLTAANAGDFTNDSIVYTSQANRDVTAGRIESTSEIFQASGFISVSVGFVEFSSITYTADVGGLDTITPNLFVNSSTFYTAGVASPNRLDNVNEIYKPIAGAPGSFMFQDNLLENSTAFYPALTTYTLPYIDHSIMPVGTQPYGMGWDRIAGNESVIEFSVIYEVYVFGENVDPETTRNVWYSFDESKTWYPVDPLESFESTTKEDWSDEI